MRKELKPCPFCGHSIDIEKDVYEPSRDWHPTFIDPDSGGDPINIHCKCGLEFCTGTYDWGEFVEAWNRRANDGKIDADKLKADLEKAISKNEDMDCLDFLRVASFIDAQPTAYDPDKVVRQLEDYGNEETHYYKNTPYEKCIEECIGKAIQIVKGGGVDAKTDS